MIKKQYKLLVLGVCLLLFILPLCGNAHGAANAAANRWDGKSTKPIAPLPGTDIYVVYTAAQLAWLANESNSLTGIDFSKAEVLLAADIDLGYYPWLPIGARDEKRWEGNFDGRGYSIFGLGKYLAGTTLPEKHAGLFGQIGAGGKVINVTLAGVDITFDAAPLAGNTITCGALAGANYGLIKNCTSSGEIIAGGGDTNYLGGLVGVNRGQVSLCASSVRVLGEFHRVDSIVVNAGGLVGSNQSALNDSYALGTVRVQMPLKTNALRSLISVGGLAGTNYCLINRTYADVLTVTNWGVCGGLVGGNDQPGISEISQSYCVLRGMANQIVFRDRGKTDASQVNTFAQAQFASGVWSTQVLGGVLYPALKVQKRVTITYKLQNLTVAQEELPIGSRLLPPQNIMVGERLIVGFSSGDTIARQSMVIECYSLRKTYTVTFHFPNGTKTAQAVSSGDEAAAPAPPMVEGYVFAGFSRDLFNILADTDIYLIYEPTGK